MVLAAALDAGPATVNFILVEDSVFPCRVYNFGNAVIGSDGQQLVEGKRCTGSCCLRRKVADWTAR